MMHQPDQRAPSISLEPREPRLRARWARDEPPGQRPAPAEDRYDYVPQAGPAALVVAFLVGAIGLSVWSWADVAVRAVWGALEGVQ